MKWKDLSLKERKQIYDSVRVNNPDATYFDIKEQFDSIPTYEDGGKNIITHVNSSNANFVNRLKSPTRSTIQDWETQYVSPYFPKVDDKFNLVYNSRATHKLSAWEGDNNTGLIVPYVQEVDGKLVDYTRPPYNDRAALDNAFKTGDFVVTDKYDDAQWYTENYKKYYPKFKDGGKVNKEDKAIKKEDLPPEYRTGTPEYFERQRKISGAVNAVQPEAYITPAGYIKDAVNFIEDLGKGDYAGAAMDAVLNLIPWGVGKGIKKLKSKVGRIIEGTEVDGVSVHSFAPTQTKKKTKKKTEEDYDSEFSEVLRKDRNSKKYQQEISRTIEQAIFPDERTRELVKNVDKTYGTNYKRAYSNIAYKDMTKRGSYVKWGNTDKDGYGQINIKNIKDNVLPTDINDYNIVLDNNIYMPGTANHELGHVADGLAGSRKIQDFDSGKEYITNTYLNYLANSNNTYSSAELRKMGLFDAAGSRTYLLNPTEAKSHMLTLKRSLKDSGKITNWSTPVDEKMILEYMRNPTSNKMVKNQYDLYRNKNEYIDRLNKLIPMEILMPLGGAGFAGYELNKE
jgi:hypothetical protein